MDKKVNVLLSAYNGEKYIREQIESILEQSYKNIEIYDKRSAALQIYKIKFTVLSDALSDG